MNKDAALLCFFRRSNNQAQRLAGRDFIAIMAPVPFFSCDFDSQRWCFYLKIWYNAAADSRRGEFGQLAGPSQTPVRESKLERETLGEIERESKRGLKKKKKKVYIANDKSKLKVCCACCHSLPFIFRKQTAVIIDLMVQLEWKHFWA